MRTYRWYSLMKTAADHGNTMSGQMKASEAEMLLKAVARLKNKAIANDMTDVLPRWQGEAKRMIFQLPPMDRIANMSMYELEQLSEHVENINDYMRRYSAKRMNEILGR